MSDFPLLQPREKLEAQGPLALQTEELLSIILCSGSRDAPVKLLAQRIQQLLSRDKTITFAELKKIHGIGSTKAAQVLALLELVERFRPRGYPVIDSLQKVLSLLGDIRYADREHVVAMYLNTRLQLMLKETLAVGGLNQTIVSPRDILGAIKHHPVAFIILAHNHPSGEPQASPEDLALTLRLQKSCELIGVELLDHVIVAHEKHYSCKEHQHL